MTKNRAARKAAPKIGEDVTRVESQLRDIMRLVRTQDADGQFDAYAFHRVCRWLAKAERSLDSCCEYLKNRESKLETKASRDDNDETIG